MDKNINPIAEFSVLMSVYYKEKAEFLELALKSIWDDQLTKPSEIILVKDGPLTHELNETINKFANKAPLKIVTLKKNMGLGIALAEGLKHCKYELVARMDSDDISVPERFMKQLKFFLKFPNTSILGGQILEFIDTPKNIVGYRKVPVSKDEIIKFSKSRSPFNHPSVMFKKSIILSAGNYIDLFFLEDYYLWLRVLNINDNVANLSDNILFFRTGKDVIGRRHGKFYFKQEIKLAKIALANNYISYPQFIKNIIFRGFPRTFPKPFLAHIYKLIHKREK